MTGGDGFTHFRLYSEEKADAGPMKNRKSVGSLDGWLQKEWKREEMKQNQGRTEQNQRKRFRKDRV